MHEISRRSVLPAGGQSVRLIFFAVIAAPLLTPLPAWAQFLGQEDMAVTQPAMTGQFWAPKPARMMPYVAPNKPHWKLSEVLAAHKGRSDWVQPLVRNKDQEADYISMGTGEKTKMKMWPDDRLVFVVWAGSIRVSIDGYQPLTATKGFMVNVPFRHMYTLENVGSTPALRFEVRQTGSTPVYPASETPDPALGMTYVKVTEQPGPAKEKDSNPIYVDYMKSSMARTKLTAASSCGMTTSLPTSCAALARRCLRTPTRATSISAGPNFGSLWKAISA
jgi:mannose-6-phosphate isomerase-like protein (cupin superfamily)